MCRIRDTRAGLVDTTRLGTRTGKASAKSASAPELHSLEGRGRAWGRRWARRGKGKGRGAIRAKAETTSPTDWGPVQGTVFMDVSNLTFEQCIM